MYRKDSEGWLKHFDFLVLDLLCLQVAFVLAYGISGYGFYPYNLLIYRNMAIFIEFADIVVLFACGSLKNVLKRGHYREFLAAFQNTIMLGAVAILYLFLLRQGQKYSRLALILNMILYFFLTYIVREIRKYALYKKMKDSDNRSLLIITTKEAAEKVVSNMEKHNYARFHIAGLAIIDENMVGSSFGGVTVVANRNTAPEYVCKEWIDEVFVVLSPNYGYPKELMEELGETGVTIHLNLAKITNEPGKRQFIEKIGDYTVLTTSLNYSSAKQLCAKRCMDIAGGLAGCILTGVIFLFVAPIIYMQSPGPIFFSQERVGENGKKFKMYKFRSMYMDAEERKAELMKDNKLGDGKMFKLDFDPRVIGNKILREVNTLHCQKIMTNMADEDYRTATICQTRIALYNMLDYAYQSEIIPKNPCNRMVKSDIGKESSKKEALTIENQKKFCEAIKGTSYEYQYRFALQTGLRTGELVGL